MRDYSLDLLRGLSCILMILAHSAASGIEQSPLVSIFVGENDRVTHLLYMLGEAAPIMFFSIAGVTAYLQAKKYPPRPVFISYIFLFLLGLSYNGITQGDFYESFYIEMIQIIAIGGFLVYILEYTKKPPPVVYLMIAIAIFALKLLSDHSPWLEQLLAFRPGFILPPGPFPLLPWLYLFFMGAFAHNTKNVYNLILGAVTIAILVILKLVSFPLELGNKWDMSLGYFLLSCLVLFSVFYLIRRIDFLRQERGKRLFLFWGQFSLLFLFVHKFVIRVLHHLHLAMWPSPYVVPLREPFVFWLAVLVITSILMKLLLELSKVRSFGKPFQGVWGWIALVSLILLVPALIGNPRVIYGLELLLGILFAVYYPLFRKAVKQPTASGHSLKASRRFFGQ